jgi:hypothetical protein
VKENVQADARLSLAAQRVSCMDSPSAARKGHRPPIVSQDSGRKPLSGAFFTINPWFSQLVMRRMSHAMVGKVGWDDNPSTWRLQNKLGLSSQPTAIAQH